MSLIDQLRKARESRIEVGEWVFTIRRPTDMEVIELQEQGGLNLRNALQFVTGWNLREIDLIPGGAPDPVPFDAELFREWVADRPEVWSPLAEGIGDAYRRHAARMEADSKN